jgi:hypothetical protein
MMTDLKKLRDSNPVDPSLYRQLIGSLMYLENTQSDICCVGRLSYDIQLHGFIDSDWAGSADDKRSATWICFSLSFATMSWDSRKQKSDALNTAEVEYIAACDACMEAVWLCKLVSRLFDQVLDFTVIYCDDQSCVKLSENWCSMTGRSTLRSSIIFSVIKSRGEKWFSSISPQMSI